MFELTIADDSQYNGYAAQIAVLITLGLAGGCYLMLFLSTMFFIRKYALNFKMLLLFFMMLHLALLSRIVFFIYLYLTFKHDGKLHYYCLFTILREISYSFFVAGVIFGLFHWVILISEIKILGKEQQNIMLIINKAWLAILQIFSFGLFATSAVIGGNDVNDLEGTILKIIKFIVILFYFIMAAAFAVYGIKMYRGIKHISYLKALAIKNRIIFSILLISGPLVIRGGYKCVLLIFKFEDFLLRSVKDNGIEYPIFIITYYSFTDLVPIAAQIISVSLLIKNSNVKIFSSSSKTDSKRMENSNEGFSNKLIKDSSSSRSLFVTDSFCQDNSEQLSFCH